MIAKRRTLGQFLVIDISQDGPVIADLQELNTFIEGLTKEGHLNIAIRFNNISYLLSGVLGVLLQNAKSLRQKNGEICLLEPNKAIKDIIKVARLDMIFRTFHSEDELLAYQSKK
jgi:anti-anti-sigma factor